MGQLSNDMTYAQRKAEVLRSGKFPRRVQPRAPIVDENMRALLLLGFAVLIGFLLGVGLMKAAHAAQEPTDDEIAALDPLGIPIDLPGWESVAIEVGIGEAVPDPYFPIPTRHARWGRPLDPAMIARKLTFTARFAIFPEYIADVNGAPTLRGSR